MVKTALPCPGIHRWLKPRDTWRKTVTWAVIVVGSLALTPAVARASTHKTTTTHPKKAAPRKKLPPGIGYSFTLENEDKQYEAVKLDGVVDPAQGADQFTSPGAGKRFVAVEITITGKSPGNDANDANDNLSLVGTNRQVYSPGFDSVSECTDFDNGQYTVTKGQSEKGCVTFQIPTGVYVAQVKYNPNAGFSTNEAVWTFSIPG